MASWVMSAGLLLAVTMVLSVYVEAQTNGEIQKCILNAKGRIYKGTVKEKPGSCYVTCLYGGFPPGSPTKREEITSPRFTPCRLGCTNGRCDDCGKCVSAPAEAIDTEE